MVKLGTSSRTDKMAKHEEPEGLEVFRRATEDLRLAKRRRALARFSTNIFSGAGNELHLIGHIIGTDRVSGASPWGHGTDETVAISVLLRIASQLVAARADLFKDGRAYAAAALLRQLVEIEYLAWAFETRHRDAERWLRSDQKEREAFFRPAKLRVNLALEVLGSIVFVLAFQMSPKRLDYIVDAVPFRVQQFRTHLAIDVWKYGQIAWVRSFAKNLADNLARIMGSPDSYAISTRTSLRSSGKAWRIVMSTSRGLRP
jgi:hypothetical protein